jgi:hypothetical protein
MSNTATAAPPTGRDLLPSPDELVQRLASNIQERQVLEGLLKVVEKDQRLRASAGRLRAMQRPRQAVPA